MVQLRAMSKWARQLARRQHAFAVLLYTAAVVVTSVWVDFVTQGFTDVFRDVLVTAFVIVFGLLVADLVLSIEASLRRKLAASVSCWQGLVWGVPLGFVIVLFGHALLPLGALVVQVPRVGFVLLRTIGVVAEFVVQKAWLPALITGAVSALAHRSLCFWLSGDRSVAGELEQAQPKSHGNEHRADA